MSAPDCPAPTGLAPLESRRQTGPGRLLDTPGAALEVHAPEALRAPLAAAWRRHARALLDGLGWNAGALAARPFPRGLSLAVGAPIDGLYTATALNEAALAAAAADVSAGLPLAPPEPRAETLARLRAARDAEARPALLALAEAAAARRLSLLWDDAYVTLGSGAGSRSWPADALPAPDAVDWRTLSDVPVALVTGTNGKSTTARLLAAMARAAGFTPGLSTTDYVAVGDIVIEQGDFSGPMGARAALRDRRVTLGVLEVARGGLLRRGVPLTTALAAAVTNVAADHLGEYGVDELAALAEAKFTVAKALRPGGVLVVAADEPVAADEAARQAEALRRRGVRLAWTALDPDHPRLAAALAPDAPPAATLRDDWLAVARDGAWSPLLPAAEAPLTLGGTAVHNLRNALTAVALGVALGLPDAALTEGLLGFRGDATDNPGRANRFTVRGAEALVDYAHNAHGMAALVALAAARPARRRLVLLSSAGDRRDEDLEAMAAAVAPLRPDRVLLADLPDYLRGRAPGEVPARFVRAFAAHGVPESACQACPDPAAGVREAVAWARPGDHLLLFVLSHRDEALALLQQENDMEA
ncbi:MAG: Mur ligase family protein [Rubricoccaceae bacterium]